MKRLLLSAVLALLGTANAFAGFGGTGFGSGASAANLLASTPTFTSNVSAQNNLTVGTTFQTLISSSGYIVLPQVPLPHPYQQGILFFGADGHLHFGPNATTLIDLGGTGGASFSTYGRNDFTALANGVTTEFVMSTAPASASVFVVLDGLIQRDGVDYSIAGTTITMATAPASDTNSFFAAWSISNVDGQSLTGIQRSSTTALPNTAFTNTSFGAATSTVTFTSRGGRARVIFSGITSASSINRTIAASFLVDGAYPERLSGGKAAAMEHLDAAGSSHNIGFNLNLNNLTPGTHSFALLLKTDGGTVTLHNDATRYSEFSVYEVLE